MSADDWVTIDEVPSLADYRALNEYDKNGSTPEPNSWTPISLADLDEQPPVQPTLGQLGIVYPGKRHIFSGPQESAKTLAAYVIALEVVRHDGPIVLIDFEMGRWDARTRLRELGATPDDLNMISYVEPAEKAAPDDIRALIALEPQLVLIDAAAGAFDLEGLDDNRRQDVERFAGIYVRAFWTHGIATIILDHVVKNSETRGAYAIGSERKVGGADVHLGFVTIDPIRRGGTGRYKITTHKDRGGFLKRGKLADVEFASDPSTHTLTWKITAAQDTDDDAPFRPTHLMEKVSRYLERQPEPVIVGDLKESVTGKATFVLEALAVLVQEGFVQETSGARGARLLESVKAYREGDDDPFPTHSHPFPEPAEPTHSPFPSLEGTGGDGVAGIPRSIPDTLDDDIPW